MKALIKLTAAALAVAALAGCDHGLGVSGSSSTKAATSSELNASTESSTSAKKTLTASIRMSGATLAASALTGLARQQLVGTGTSGMDKLQWALLLQEGYAGPQAVANQALRAQEAVAQAVHKPLAEVVHVVPAFQHAKLTPESAYLHAAAALAVARSAAPIQGWPFQCFGCAKEARWAREKAREVAFANLLETQVLGQVQGAVLADPRTAKARLDASLASMPDSTILAAWAQAAPTAQGSLSLDFSGSQPAPVHYLLGSSDLQGGPTGWKLAQAGTTWFGDGKVSGREISLDLASAIDTGATTSTSTQQSGSAGTDTGSEGSAGVK